jgi:hypothetical protein
MEIRQVDMANICGVKRQSIRTLLLSGKLVKSESGKLNVHDPKNNRYLLDHGKSVLDVEKYMNENIKPAQCLPSGGKKRDNETLKLVQAVKSVIINRYDEDEAKTIMNLIYREVVKN